MARTLEQWLKGIESDNAEQHATPFHSDHRFSTEAFAQASDFLHEPWAKAVLQAAAMKDYKSAIQYFSTYASMDWSEKIIRPAIGCAINRKMDDDNTGFWNPDIKAIRAAISAIQGQAYVASVLKDLKTEVAPKVPTVAALFESGKFEQILLSALSPTQNEGPERFIGTKAGQAKSA